MPGSERDASRHALHAFCLGPLGLYFAPHATQIRSRRTTLIGRFSWQ